MPNQQPDIPDASVVPDSPARQATLAYEPGTEEEAWLDEPVELPRRPRRRLLTPLPLSLAAVLLIACGFIGGVLVEKGQSTSSSASGATGGLASRIAALRSGATGTSARSGSTGGAGGFLGAGAGGGGGRTAGQVAYLAGSSLYVTNSEGNTIKVTTSAGTSVSKTVASSVKRIHPGETVTVIGSTGAHGTVSAESISVGSSGGGLAALFGASGARGGSSGAAGGAGGGSPTLFGNGG